MKLTQQEKEFFNEAALRRGTTTVEGDIEYTAFVVSSDDEGLVKFVGQRFIVVSDEKKISVMELK